MKQSKKLVLLVGAIGLVAVFIYGYSNYGLEFGKFFAAEPSGESTVLGTPLGVPVTTPAQLPTNVLMNGNNTLAKYSIASEGQTTWLKRIAFSIEKTPVISLSNIRIFEDGADITSLGAFTTFGILAGNTSARIVFTSNNERSLASGHIYTLKATVTGVSGPGMSIVTSIRNPGGTGTFQPMTYTGGLESARAVSLVWTDRSAKKHNYTTLDWFSDRNVQMLPMTWAIWTQ